MRLINIATILVVAVISILGRKNDYPNDSWKDVFFYVFCEKNMNGHKKPVIWLVWLFVALLLPNSWIFWLVTLFGLAIITC